MSETITAAEARAAAAAPDVSPFDILLHVIVILLAPMFLVASDGDIDFARMAALETVNSYGARNHADLIAIAQIIACGLASVGSLSLSMADNLPLAMTIRLRANAVALNRAAEQTRRALRETQSNPAPPPDTGHGTDDGFDEATVIANVAATRQRAAAFAAEMQINAPPAVPAPVETPPSPVPLTEDQQRQALWATAAAQVAGEYTASLPHLTPAERRRATLRAAALNSCAQELLSGNNAPRPRPGDLNAIMPPNPV